MDSGKFVVDALSWAAGGNCAAPDFDGLDTDGFAEALHAHRLDARLLRRLRTDGVAAPPPLAQRLTERLTGVRRDVARRAELARRLDEIVGGDPLHGLVPLKGFTLLGLTGSEHALRHSGDLDVVVADAPEFVRRAAALGLRPEGPQDILDEYARLVVERHGMVEVHSYYPVPYWRSRTTDRECDPRAHPGAWTQQAHLGEARMRHRDLVGALVAASGLPGGGRVLRPEAAVVVQAAHVFGDYVRTVLPLPMGTARLDEIAAVIDLCALPGFDFRYFASLVERFTAHDVVAFVRAVAIDLLGRDPIPAGTPLELPEDRFFPVDLWWDGVEGLLVDLGWHPAELVVRSRPHTAVLHRLGEVPIPVPAAGATTRVAAGTGDADDLDRYVIRPVRSTRFPVGCEISADDSGLSLVVSAPAAEAGTMLAVSLNFGDHRFEFFYQNAADRLQFDDYSLTVPSAAEVGRAAVRKAGRDVLTVHLPWSRLGDADRTRRPMALLLGVRRQALPWGGTDGVAILPLRLEFGPA